MRVKFVVLSLVVSLSSVTFAWGFFGPSAKDVESLFIEKWHGSGVLDMKSVKATKTGKMDIWKVTYTESYCVNEEKDCSATGSETNGIHSAPMPFSSWLKAKNAEKQEKPKLKHVVETNSRLVSVRKVDGKLKFLPTYIEE